MSATIRPTPGSKSDNCGTLRRNNLHDCSSFVESLHSCRAVHCLSPAMAKKYHPRYARNKKGGLSAALFTFEMLADQRTPALRSAAGVKSRADAL